MTDHTEPHWHFSLKRSVPFTFDPSDELAHHSIQSQATFGEYAHETAMPPYFDSARVSPGGPCASHDDSVARLCKPRHREDRMLTGDKAELDPGAPIDKPGEFGC